MIFLIFRMLILHPFLLTISCLLIKIINSMDIELIINEDYLQTRQFNYLTNLKNEQNLNCSFKYIFENKEMIVGRHLKNENNFIFYNIPNELINEGEMGGNKKYSEVEFIIELPSNLILQKYISVPKNQVFFKKLKLKNPPKIV